MVHRLPWGYCQVLPQGHRSGVHPERADATGCVLGEVPEPSCPGCKVSSILYFPGSLSFLPHPGFFSRQTG